MPTETTMPVFDPITALYLFGGTIKATSVVLLEELLNYWRGLARPIPNPQDPEPSRYNSRGMLRMREIFTWALWVRRRGELVDVNILSSMDISLTHSHPHVNRSFDLLVCNPDGSAVQTCSVRWQHDRASLALVRAIAPHRDSIWCWPDPTAIEMETFLIEPDKDTCPRFPFNFGVGPAGTWNLFGVTWPGRKGGVVRLDLGRSLVVTIPQVLSNELIRSAARALSDDWTIRRLSVLPR